MKRISKRSQLSPWRKKPLKSKTSHSEAGDVVCMDAIDFLHSLRDEVADVVFLDPPFNLGKQYGNGNPTSDSLDNDDYLHFLAKVIRLSIQKLKPGGALFIYHIPRWAVQLTPILSNQLQFRHWIAISMKNGFPIAGLLYPAHYALLYYTKGTPKRFRRPKLAPKTCRHCGKMIKDYGGKKDFIRDGLNLSDFWEDLSPVRHKKYKNRPSNELPMAIPMRALKMCGRRGGLLVDPFAGSGTSLVAAQQIGMHFVASDNKPEYCAAIRKRLKNSSTRKNNHE